MTKSIAKSMIRHPMSPVVRQIRPSSKPRRRVLLVVDDDENVCKALRRLLRRDFDEVMTAKSSSEAGSLLESKSVTHLICDYWLGRGQPLGVELIPTWRRRFPSIDRAVIFTGNEIDSIPVPLGVDRILSKSLDPMSLIKFLS